MYVSQTESVMYELFKISLFFDCAYSSGGFIFLGVDGLLSMHMRTFHFEAGERQGTLEWSPTQRNKRLQ